MTKGVKENVILAPSTTYTLSAVVSSAAAVLVPPVARAVNVGFAEGTSTTVAQSVFQISGSSIASINVTGCPDFTFAFDATLQRITITPVSPVFVGSDVGTFTITDINAQKSAPVPMGVTTQAVVVVNNNIVFLCSTFNDATFWTPFNTPSMTFGSFVADPFGGTNAQQVTFPTNRTGTLQVFSPTPSAGQYTASIYARIATGTGQFQLAYYHGDFPQTQVSAVFVPTSTWTRFGPFTFTIAAGDSGPSIVLENIGGDNTATIPATETLELVGLKVEPGTTMTGFGSCAVVPIPVAGAVSTSAQTNTLSTFQPNVTGPYTSLTITTPAAHGTAGVSGLNLTYQSNSGFAGTDTFRYTATNSSGTSTPGLVTETVTAVVVGILPPRILGEWLFNYSGPDLGTMQSATRVNYASWVVALGDGSQNGVVHLDTGISDAQMTAWKNAGRIVVLMLGGQTADPGDTGDTRLLSQTHQDQMFNSLVGIIDAHGFQGVDCDLEGGRNQYDPNLLNGLFGRLKGHYGSNFIISIAPAPFEITGGAIYNDVYNAGPNNIDLVSTQYYSQFNQSDDWFINQYIVPGVIGSVNSGIPASKILIGASDNSGDAGAPGGPATYITAYNQLISQHNLTVRGFTWWSTNSDGPTGWNGANRFANFFGF